MRPDLVPDCGRVHPGRRQITLGNLIPFSQFLEIQSHKLSWTVMNKENAHGRRQGLQFAGLPGKEIVTDRAIHNLERWEVGD